MNNEVALAPGWLAKTNAEVLAWGEDPHRRKEIDGLRAQIAAQDISIHDHFLAGEALKQEVLAAEQQRDELLADTAQLRKAASDYLSAVLRDNAKRDTRQSDEAWGEAINAAEALRKALATPSAVALTELQAREQAQGADVLDEVVTRAQLFLSEHPGADEKNAVWSAFWDLRPPTGTIPRVVALTLSGMMNEARAQGAADERERCAKTAEQYFSRWREGWEDTKDKIAAEIRALPAEPTRAEDCA